MRRNVMRIHLQDVLDLLRGNINPEDINDCDGDSDPVSVAIVLLEEVVHDL